MKESSEKNLWQYLPRILELYPRLNRMWLYFDEGDMLMPEGGYAAETRPDDAALAASAARVRELEGEVSRLRQELLTSKDKIISLYEQQATGERAVFTSAPQGPHGTGAAAISATAARMSAKIER